jgi:hypothetical protein
MSFFSRRKVPGPRTGMAAESLQVSPAASEMRFVPVSSRRCFAVWYHGVALCMYTVPNVVGS